jgi:hypothetical protein
MSLAVASYKINQFVIKTLDGTKAVDITNSLLFFDYYEDILSPCVTAVAVIMNSSSLFNILPIRGGESVIIDVSTAFGDFVLDDNYSMYVYKVSGLDAEKGKEMFTLHMVSREGLTNETVRCQRKYQGNLKNTVTTILKDVLLTEKYEENNIEVTSNDYSFIGNNKKPFHTLTWLGPKAVPATGPAGGTSGGGQTGEAKGTAGFLFYENKDGFNFRSIDSLVSPTQIQIGSTNKENIPSYFYTQVIEDNKVANEFKILNYSFEKNSDLMKSLRVGTYANKTYFYDLYTNKLDLYTYRLKDQINNKLGSQDKLAVSEEFGESITRIMVRTSDRGALNSDGTAGDAKRNGADMAMSYSRYNILFGQALNMIVPCNINLKVGAIIYSEFPRIDSSNTAKVDEEQSGYYLIKELRHHFEGGQLITSLRLIRDSYGLYGPNT